MSQVVVKVIHNFRSIERHIQFFFSMLPKCGYLVNMLYFGNLLLLLKSSCECVQQIF